MAVSKLKTGWMQLYTQMRRPNGALTRMFTVKPGNIYEGTKVAIDIERYGEDVAVAITQMSGPNLNDVSQYTTKEFEPPTYGEGVTLNVIDTLTRMAGVDPFTAAYKGYAAQITTALAKAFQLIGDKITRAVELQAAQILQTGKLTLTNKSGDTVYELDFKPKAAHFPTVSVAWSAPTSTKLADIEALAELIRTNGQVDPDELWFGSTAASLFFKDEAVLKQLDNLRMTLGEVAPQYIDAGVTYFGSIWIGQNKFNMFGYRDTYKHPQTGVATPYIGVNNVIVKSSKTRLDMTSAVVPIMVSPDPRVANLLPGRMASKSQGFDVTPNVYVSPNNKAIMGDLESRPLLIPVQIDGFGCLKTVL